MYLRVGHMHHIRLQLPGFGPFVAFDDFFAWLSFVVVVCFFFPSFYYLKTKVYFEKACYTCGVYHETSHRNF